jgi:hypothetical protein
MKRFGTAFILTFLALGCLGGLSVQVAGEERSGESLIVALQVRNGGGGPEVFNPAYLSVLDDRGVLYTPLGGLGAYAIEPGGVLELRVAFQIPEGRALREVRYRSMPLEAK